MNSSISQKIQETVLSIPSPTKFSVEFGAWDGVYLLNSRPLILDHGHQAVLIEADKKKYFDLKQNYQNVSGVECLNALVGWTPEDGLDSLLKATSCPKNPDFLSIDVDGNDYHIWKAVQMYRPSVVCIEFNPTIPKDVYFIQDADPLTQQGCSLRSLCQLAETKGYRIVHVDFRDVLFGSKEFFAETGNKPLDWESVSMDTSAQTSLFVGYDGRLLLQGAATLRWNGLRFYEEDIQILPGWLRKYPDNMNYFQKLGLRIYRLLRRWRSSWRRRLGFPLHP